jgi:DNA repair protein SbcC/Rad50
MIPHHLNLVNFLSYRDCQLDFSGLHTACVCGSNGSGKSSLLEALTWALWGKSRADSDDDVIRRGATEAKVDLTFGCEGQTFRIIRNRTLNKSSSLEFQVSDGSGGFRPLTRQTIRSTQEGINEVLKMDYETFINSAYLRQGRADEFTLKRPAERKEVLVEILNLKRYETLSEQSKEKEKYFANQVQILKETLQRSKQAIAERPVLLTRRETMQGELIELRKAAKQADEKLTLLRAQQRQREQLAQAVQALTKQVDQATQSQTVLQSQVERQTRTVRELEVLLQQEAQIAQGCSLYQQLQTEEAAMGERFTRHQALTNRCQEVERRREAERYELNLQLQRHQNRLEHFKHQQQEAQVILQDAPKVEQGLAELARARATLTSYDQRQREAFPKLQEKLHIEAEIHRQKSDLQAQLGLIDQQIRKLQQDLTKKSFHEQTLAQVSEKLEILEKKRVYHMRVMEKGHERRAFKDRIELQQQQFQREQVRLDEKTQLLDVESADCPLCGGPLDADHRQKLREDYQKQRLELDDQLILFSHQLSTADHEVRILRQEYVEIQRELEQTPSLLTKQAQLRQQLSVIEEGSTQIQQLRTQLQDLKQQIERQDFGQELRNQLAGIEQEIQLINYDEKEHAMARSEADRWRWAEIRQGEIDRARKLVVQIEVDLPPLQTIVETLSHQLEQEQFALDLFAQIQNAKEQIAGLNYDLNVHQQLRKQLQESQHWLLRQQEWQKARNRHPEEVSVLKDLQKQLQQSSQNFQELQKLRSDQQLAFAEIADHSEAIQQSETILKENRQSQEMFLSELGALEERISQIDTLEKQAVEQQKQLDQSQHQQQLFKELTRAFGKNGIQTLIIENVLPELETETNQLLSRLCDNQLHVQFVTQKATKNARKMIDTLEILIADARGTRPYETYSGGEAYRVNFAIRLALSRLLARRSGAALQTLIIDEGFGTQDQEGRERLVQSINAVADDFSRILVITHIQELKEAFQSRIEVEKNHQGSHLSVIM